jgi:hypothetical protein
MLVFIFPFIPFPCFISLGGTKKLSPKFGNKEENV